MRCSCKLIISFSIQAIYFLLTVGHNQSKMTEENEMSVGPLEDDDLLLDKIEEAIKSPEKVKTNGNADSTKKEEFMESSKEDEILNGSEEEFSETLIDQKAEDELLGLEDEQPNSLNDKFDELFHSVQNEKDNQDTDISEKSEVEKESVIGSEVEKEEESVVEESPKIVDDDSKPEETGLLDECEPPKEITEIDEQSNEAPSNEDDESNHNGVEERISDQELNTESSEEATKETNEVDTPEETKEPCEDTVSEEKEEAITESNQEEPEKEDDLSSTALVIDESLDKIDEATDDVPKITDESNDSAIPLVEDVEMKENGETPSEIEQISKEPEVPESMDVEMTDTNDDTIPIVEDEKPIIKVEIKSELKDDKSKLKISPPEPVKLNFMRKFAKECVKLSRADLEELLLQKVTESIVYRSESTELRNKFQKQEDMIDRLQKRVATLTKQYNDLDMIHKRIEKDLKDRPDGPIQPVRITRAVGLQVFLEQRGGSLGVNNASTKGKPLTVTTSIISSASKNTTIINKRAVDSELIIKNHNEPEPKRKKCKIITPLRPTLSEKEETSLKMQVTLK